MEYNYADSELYARIKTTTQTMIDGVIGKIDITNPAFIIYSKLNETLQQTPSLIELFENQPLVKTQIEELLSIVELDNEYQEKEGIDKKKRGWNILGDQLAIKLHPRFIKQKPFDHTRDKYDQAAEWMQTNKNLNTDDDHTTVVAGFLAIHFVK